MVQQSQNAWQSNSPDPVEDFSTRPRSGPTVGAWMKDVLGTQGASASAPSAPAQPVEPQAAAPAPDLQSRLAAIARNIEALETRVTGDTSPPASSVHASPAHQAPASPVQPSMDPLEALRRRKMELDGADTPLRDRLQDAHSAGFASQPSSNAPVPEKQSASPVSAADAAPSHNSSYAAPTGSGTSLDLLSARLDDQFSRLTQAIGDVRQIAEAGIEDKARLDALEHHLAGNGPGNDSQGAALADLSDQVRAVRDAITAMPAPDAIKSLEDGYNHVLARLDTLKSDGASDQKIDALYEEVTGLRELLDQIRDGGMASVVEEMRAMLARLESEPGADSARIAQALEAATSMAESQGSAGLTDAIGAVVERLVALEARIEALAAGADNGPLTSRLDAIQNEMSRLSTFQDEAKGLSQALDAVRDEVRSSNAGVDWSAFDQRFGALDRIEQMTGGYADQISSLSERLSSLDGSIASQGDMARQVSALSRQMETFTNAMPVREIEQAVLELTGRVTALQEDTGTERLAIAVRELGERVESCIRSIPKTEAIIEAVEAKIGEQLEGQLETHLSTAMEPMINRLDTLHTAITDADGPLIEHMAGRLESLIRTMPTPRAEDALAALEQQLGEINQRQASAGVISRDDVTRLHNELTRARASVELGSNRDLQRAIVDQVRHLADRFENARATGDAAILPEVEAQIEALAGRVQSLGLFDAQSGAAALPDDLIQHLDRRLDDLSAAQTTPIPGVDQLHDELAALRRNAGDQDLRMQQTLENMQQAMENVGQRIAALEGDDRAALNLAKSATVQPYPVEKSIPDASVFEQTAEKPSNPTGQWDDAADQRDEVDAKAPAATFEEAEEAPAPGDAQDLLRQLSGAMNIDGSEPTAPASDAGSQGKPPRTPRAPRVRQGPALREAINTTSSSDAASQRASFIAAARRAAQSAALQATAQGASNPVRAQAAVDPSLDPFASSPSVKGARTEPKIDAIEPNSVDERATALTAAQQLGGAAKTSRVEQKKNKKKEVERQKTVSRAMLFALVLFTLGLAGFVVTLILPADRVADIAPLAAIEAPADVEALAAEEAAEAAANDPRILATEDTSEPVRVIGEESASVSADIDTAARAADDTSEAGVVPASQPSSSTEETRGSGFERDRGPVMAQTPNIDVADVSLDAPQQTATPEDSLGPFSGLSVPALPPATANALPESIGSPRLRVAASGGDSAAQFEVATRYMEGRFVPQDFAAAAHWYGLAADQGSVPAAYRLGSFYEQGRGVDRDSDSAIAWYEQSARGGNPRGMHNLAVMAAEGRGVGGATSPDFERASGWFRAAADRGLSDSQFNLAVLYARGMGVERDLLESYKWFALAANGGDSEAVGRRDEVAGVLGEEALALARARVDNWQAIPIEPTAVGVAQPDGGWDDSPVRASGDAEVTTAQAMIARAQALLAQRGYEPGPADGLIGPRTTDAVRAFRQSVGLGDTDTIDEALLNALSGAGNL